MTNRKKVYVISTTTPIFSYGADRETPEIRATSIRGMVRWWFRALGKEDESKKIMGDAAGSKESGASASKVIFRVVTKDNIEVKKANLLPHKNMATKKAIASASVFELHVIERFKLEDKDWELLQRVIETWLMLGTIGARSTRAGGCVYDSSLVFKNKDEWLLKARELLKGSKIEVHISSARKEPLGELRKYCTDTVKNSCLGSANPRKESPLRFKIIKIGEAYHIAFINDTRKEDVLERACSVLNGKEIGKILIETIKSHL